MTRTVTVVPPALVVDVVDVVDVDAVLVVGVWMSTPHAVPAAAGPVPGVVDPDAAGCGTGTTVDGEAVGAVTGEVGAGSAGCWLVGAGGAATAAACCGADGELVGVVVGLVAGVGVSAHVTVGLGVAGRGGATTARPAGTVVGPAGD
jgi:hypothetical protein